MILKIYALELDDATETEKHSDSRDADFNSVFIVAKNLRFWCILNWTYFIYCAVNVCIAAKARQTWLCDRLLHISIRPPPELYKPQS